MLRSPVSASASKRIRVCVLVKDGGLSLNAACQKVGVSQPSFTKARWIQKFESGDGSFAPLLEDNRAHAKTKLTPRTEKMAQSAAKKGKGAQEIRADLRAMHDAHGDEDWDIDPSTIRRNFRNEGRRTTGAASISSSSSGSGCARP